MRINALGNTANDFASDDYIALDGTTNGSRKMKNDSLQKVMAQNALAGNVAPAFDPTRTSYNPYKSGEIVSYNGKVYSFKVDHYGAWAGADVEQEPESQVFSRVLNNGIFEKITQMVAVEAGGYSNGKKTTNAARMRLNVPLLSPFRISTKSGYLIQTYQRLDKNGIYIDFLSVGARNLNVDSIDGYLYCVVFRKSDNSNFTEGENPIDSLEYLGGIDIYKNFILESGCLNRLNGGVVTEVGSFYQGKKIASDNRLRFNFPIIAPFSISTKTGFLIDNVIEINNDGTNPTSSAIESSTFTKSTSKGKKYLVTFKKSDNSDFVGDEDVIESFEYFGIGDIIDNFNSFKETNNGVIERLNGVVVAEAGGYSFGKKTINAARMRLNVPLIPPFKVYAKTGYVIHVVHITNNDGVYESFVSPLSTEYSQTTTSGKKYLVVFKKDDGTDFTEGENPLDHIDYEYGAYEQKRVPDSKTGSCNVFARVGVIGDSYAAGYIKIDSDARIIASDYSWPAFMERRTNRTWTNFAKSGSSCKSWVENDNPTYSNIDAVQAEGNKCQAYVIGLQINDKSAENPYHTPAGSLSDIGTTNDTYCAYLYRLISLVYSVNNDAKIFVCTLPSSSESDGYNAIVRGVVDHCKETDGWNVYCIDLYAYKDYFTSNETFVNDASYGHYTAVGYEFMAEMLFAVISKVIDSAESEFKDVYRIDYDS